MSDAPDHVRLFGKDIRVVETTFGRSVHSETFILTAKDLVEAFAKMEERRILPPCGSEQRPHAVHPRAVGWAVCANCFMPVQV